MCPFSLASRGSPRDESAGTMIPRGKRPLTGRVNPPIFCIHFPPSAGRGLVENSPGEVCHFNHLSDSPRRDPMESGQPDPGPDRHSPECPGHAAGGGPGRPPGGHSPGADLHERPGPGAQHGGGNRPAAAREVPVMMMPELRECNYGLWEGLTRPEAAGRFPGDWTLGGGEGGERPRAGKISSPGTARGPRLRCGGREGKTVLISAHRGPLRAILCHALGIDRPSGTASSWRTVRSRRWSAGRNSSRASCS